MMKAGRDTQVLGLNTEKRREENRSQRAYFCHLTGLGSPSEEPDSDRTDSLEMGSTLR